MDLLAALAALLAGVMLLVLPPVQFGRWARRHGWSRWVARLAGLAWVVCCLLARRQLLFGILMVWQQFRSLTAALMLALPVLLVASAVRQARAHPWMARCTVMAAVWWSASLPLVICPWLSDQLADAVFLRPVAALSVRASLGAVGWLGLFGLLGAGLFGGPWRLRLPGRAFGAASPGAFRWGLLGLGAAGACPLIVWATVAVLSRDAALADELERRTDTGTGAWESRLIVGISPVSGGRALGSRAVDAVDSDVGPAAAHRVSDRLWVTADSAYYADGDGLLRVRPDRREAERLALPWRLVLGVNGHGQLLARSRERGRDLVAVGRDGVPRRLPSPFPPKVTPLQCAPLPGARTIWLTMWDARQWLAIQEPGGALGAPRRLDDADRVASVPAPITTAPDGLTWLLLMRRRGAAAIGGPELAVYDESVLRCEVPTGAEPLQLAADRNGRVWLLGEAGRLWLRQGAGQMAPVTARGEAAGRLWEATAIGAWLGRVCVVDATPDGRRVRVLRTAAASDQPSSWLDARALVPTETVARWTACQPWLLLALVLSVLARSQSRRCPWQARHALAAAALLVTACAAMVLGRTTACLAVGQIAALTALLKGGLSGAAEAHMPGSAWAVPARQAAHQDRLALDCAALALAAVAVPVAYWWY